MTPQTVLLAETDQHTLNSLPPILFDHIPHLSIEICTSPDELARNLSTVAFDAIAICPLLVPHFRFYRNKNHPRLLAPLIITVSEKDLTLAHAVLEGDAFDLIIKPIVATDAAHTVRLALWQNKLLKLLASRERRESQFREHIEQFPPDSKAFEEFLYLLDSIHGALNTSSCLLERMEQESSLFDMASTLERVTKRRALDRLIHMYKPGPAH
ncbi:MAG: hypothetical protein NDI90_11170 [Nitrospira sp. BO4]|jgi:DNA-binding NtrC family response regulator|nr:hypothetical protein [Nitrospira sp. BO4]